MPSLGTFSCARSAYASTKFSLWVLCRAEVLAAHVPKDDDEWLVFETSRLTEFTRLFPPVSRLGGTNGCAAQADSAAASAASPEGDGDGDDTATAEDDAEGSSGMKGAGARSAGKFKAASYNEIICQVPTDTHL
jgi:hypothetical protein